MRNHLKLPTDAVYDRLESPVGKLTLIAIPEGLQAILWGNDNTQVQALKQNPHNKIIMEAKKQLNEYFQGQRQMFDIPLAPQGTDFQKQAWKQLSKIPYGQTISYGEQAKRLGDRNKARAVGVANSRNPLSIIVPCHRVIGANGSLTGFGGGLDTKDWLLKHEQKFTNG